MCCVLTVLSIYSLLSLRMVGPATVGVVATFGQVGPQVLTSGWHVCSPFANVIVFTTKTMMLEETHQVPTAEGLNVVIDVALLYHINPAKARDVYLSLGENYQQIVVEPELASALRGVTADHEARALYNSSRDVIQGRLLTLLGETLSLRGVIVESVLLKQVMLPPLVKQSIEAKAQAEQDAEKMVFVLQKEKQEAHRKRIEAEGIKAFQQVVSEGISAELLQWKGIEATEKFSDSPNTKIVIMGHAQDSMPVMLGGGR